MRVRARRKISIHVDGEREFLGSPTRPTVHERLVHHGRRDSAGQGKTRYFSATGCVVEYPDRRDVFVGGSLIGSFVGGDRAMRNSLIVAAASGEGVDLTKLAQAFGVVKETVRTVRLRFQEGGLAAIVEPGKSGRRRKLTPELQQRVEKMFERGLTIDEVQARLRPRVSRAVIGRAHKRWADAKKAGREREHEQQDAAEEQLSFAVVSPVSKPRRRSRGEAYAPEAPAGPAGDSQAGTTEMRLEQAVMRGGTRVQHLGAWVMIAMVHALGLHGLAEFLRRETAKLLATEGKSFVRAAVLRVAIDAVVIALALGERSVEGVRRLATPSAATLLRHRAAISATWTRRVLGRFAEPAAEQLHMTQATILVRQSERHHERDRRVVFYIDNHLRPYTGKFTVRKGWRMQDKRARPGISDYWVHDEDGRPVFRVNSPEHDSLVHWLRPIGRRLRDALADDAVRVLMVFDRAGAFAGEMAELRDAEFDFVTYERKPYSQLPLSAFDHWIQIGDARIEFAEAPRKNLGGDRGRVRRIALRMPDGEQFNVLAVSDAPADELIGHILARWSRQENQFKHGVERWGINQLDGRQVEQYPPGASIPNPARRRLERTLRVLRASEGEAL